MLANAEAAPDEGSRRARLAVARFIGWRRSRLVSAKRNAGLLPVRLPPKRQPRAFGADRVSRDRADRAAGLNTKEPPVATPRVQVA